MRIESQDLIQCLRDYRELHVPLLDCEVDEIIRRLNIYIVTIEDNDTEGEED